MGSCVTRPRENMDYVMGLSIDDKEIRDTD